MTVAGGSECWKDGSQSWLHTGKAQGALKKNKMLMLGTTPRDSGLIGLVEVLVIRHFKTSPGEGRLGGSVG